MTKLVKRNNSLSFFDDFFDDFFQPATRNVNASMKTDILELEKGYELQIDVPGFDKEDIRISLENGYLTVEAKKEKEEEKKDAHYVKRERFLGTCARSFFVGEEIAEEDIKAEYDKGTLKVFVPKEGTNVKAKKYIAIE
ncbi:MAG: Hsp20 family protein [Candidatus Izemoplasmatales bacterium]|jgi:HSP20 family molecular chaperone IbpA|nr:Hsp20 family protein [Candidatus Izemoplasmatales bacterium]